MIVKVQIPVPDDYPTSTPEQARVVAMMEHAGITPSHKWALIYTQDRHIEVEVPVEDVKDLFKAGEYKIFCKARVIRGELEIIKRVKSRPW